MGRALRFVTFLAPNMLGVYGFIARYVGRELGCSTELRVGSCYEELAAGVDVGFLCGLPYVEFGCRQSVLSVEPIAAPVLQGERYDGKPIYFSDVIVHRESLFSSFADLRGCTWSYNEQQSHSGYGIISYHLACLGETSGYFGRLVNAGFHERSIRLVAARKVDASGIDSQVLAIALRNNPALAASLRVIGTLGPSTIQPVVTSRRLPALRADLQSILLEMSSDPEALDVLAHGFIDRFVPVSDDSYDDIRAMRDAARSVQCLASSGEETLVSLESGALAGITTESAAVCLSSPPTDR
jgi:phosphonate transport system substrate-binding protein